MKSGKIISTILKACFYALFIVLVSCPSPLEDKLTEVIETEVKEATAEEYRLTIENPENGIASISGTVTVKDGIEQQILITPYQTHAFTRWEKVSGSGTIIFSSPESSETTFTVTGGDAVIRAVLTERPRIRYTTPTSSGVCIDATVMIKFSREMDPNTINENTVFLLNSNNDETVSGYINYENETVFFKPSADLPTWTKFSVKVSKEVTDINGISLSEDFLTTNPFQTNEDKDTSIPIDGTFKINSGQEWTSSQSVELTDIFARDQGDGNVAKMYFSNDGTTWSDPYTYKETASWVLDSTNGLKNVYMKFEDASGNQNHQIDHVVVGDVDTPTGGAITSAITMDTEGPAPALVVTDDTGIAIDVTDSIDGGDDPEGDMYTALQDINIYVNATDSGIGNILNTNTEQKKLQMILAQDLSFTQGEWAESDSDYEQAYWEDYTGPSAPRSFRVDPGDGTKVVLVKFRDSLGNEGSKTFDYVKLDQTPPSGTMTINNEADYSSSKEVVLNISATDSGVDSSDINNSYMCISTDPDFTTETWIDYNSTPSLELAEGENTVYIRFKDSLENTTDISDAVSDTIFIDTQAPVSGAVVINSNEATTYDRNLVLNISAEDNAGGSGISEMAFNFTDSFDESSSWIPYVSGNTAYSFPQSELPGLTGGDITGYVSFRDRAGNIISTPASDSITYYHTPPPDGEFTINGDAGFTNESDAIIISNFPSAAKMRFSTDLSSLSSKTWENYAVSYNYTGAFTGSDGEKKIYGEYADSEENIIGSDTDVIYYDTEPPVINSSNTIIVGTADDNSATNQDYVDLQNSVTDAASGTPAFMRFKNTDLTASTEWSEWYPYHTLKEDWPLDSPSSHNTYKRVYFQFKDQAGNIAGDSSTGYYYKEIFLDKTPPVVTSFWIGNSDNTDTNPDKINSTSVTLYSDVSDNDPSDIPYQMNIGNYSYPWNGFETYQEERSAWTLPSTDGIKKVYCYYKDKAGNTTSTFLNDSIELDTTPPQDVSITINEGRLYTYERDVSLTISATDVPDGSRMKLRYITSSGSYEDVWSDFASTENITLYNSDSIKYVYLQVEDDIGNISTSVYDYIYLDRPSISYITKGKPGSKGRVKAFLNRVNKESTHNIIYRIYTSEDAAGTVKTYRGSVYHDSYSTEGLEVTVPEEQNLHFWVKLYYYNGTQWQLQPSYFNGNPLDPATGDKTGYTADITVIHSDTDESIADEIINVLKTDVTANSGVYGTMPNWSVMKLNQSDVSTTYSAENIIHGDPVIVTPGCTYFNPTLIKLTLIPAARARNLAASNKGVIGMGENGWKMMSSIAGGWSSWSLQGQTPSSLATLAPIQETYTSNLYYKWGTSSTTSPWKYPLYSDYLGGASPENNTSSQITYSEILAKTSKTFIKGAVPTNGELYGRVYSGSDYYNYGLLRQGRFMIYGFETILKRPYTGHVLLINLVDKMSSVDGY